MNVELGKRYRDRVTLFEGIATARSEYLFACYRVCLTGGDPNDPKDMWFDEPSLEPVEGRSFRPVREVGARTGGYQPTPPRTGRTSS